MEPDLIEQIIHRYGFFGIMTVIFSALVLLTAWVIASIFYPVLFALPIVIFAWMVWSVRKNRDDS
jgi:cobalamin biosynthesis protein CobD/CbiB